MNVERQLALITYLLNRDIVTEKYLAEKLEVTKRTISEGYRKYKYGWYTNCIIKIIKTNSD